MYIGRLGVLLRILNWGSRGVLACNVVSRYLDSAKDLGMVRMR
jgi:hypothetical protein